MRRSPLDLRIHSGSCQSHASRKKGCEGSRTRSRKRSHNRSHNRRYKTSMSRIHYTKPSITDLEVGYASDAALNGWGEDCYAYIERFENAFCKHLGVAHAIATSSCTGALHTEQGRP